MNMFEDFKGPDFFRSVQTKKVHKMDGERFYRIVNARLIREFGFSPTRGVKEEMADPEKKLVVDENAPLISLMADLRFALARKEKIYYAQIASEFALDRVQIKNQTKRKMAHLAVEHFIVKLDEGYSIQNADQGESGKFHREIAKALGFIAGQSFIVQFEKNWKTLMEARSSESKI